MTALRAGVCLFNCRVLGPISYSLVLHFILLIVMIKEVLDFYFSFRGPYLNDGFLSLKREVLD
jgi:hypothetical protein